MMKQNSDLPLDAALFRLSPCCSASTLPARFHFGSSCFRLHFDAAELLRWRAGGWMRLRDAPTQLRGWRLEAGGGDTTCTGPIHLYWAATGAAAQAAPVVDPPLPTLFLRKKGRRRRDMAEKEAPRSFLARLPPLDRSADIGNEEKQRCVVITHHADPVLTAPLLIQLLSSNDKKLGTTWQRGQRAVLAAANIVMAAVHCVGCPRAR
eukprot:XP_023156128.1 uncharacterized protein LOC103629645 isoform X2 [Zea mays]